MPGEELVLRPALLEYRAGVFAAGPALEEVHREVANLDRPLRPVGDVIRPVKDPAVGLESLRKLRSSGLTSYRPSEPQAPSQAA